MLPGLGAHFGRVRRIAYPDHAAVTDPQAVTAYVRSSAAAHGIPDAAIDRIRSDVEAAIARECCFSVTKATGVFVCSP